MINNQPAFDPTEEQTSLTQFVSEPTEMLNELPTAKAEYPILLKIEFDPLEQGDPEDFNASDDSDREVALIFAVRQADAADAAPMEFLETPEGYTAPQFDNPDSPAEPNDDLDTLFAELADSASGQSAEVAVWCPWLVDVAKG